MRTIKEIKEDIMNVGPIIPGRLTKQKFACGKQNCRCANGGPKHGPYWQLTWTSGKKSGSRYVKEVDVPEVRQRIKNYIKLQLLIQELVRASAKLDFNPTKEEF